MYFEIESEKVKKKSGKLKLAPVCIFLNRYGVINSNIEDRSASAFPKNSLAPTIHHYRYCRRHIRDGYVYVYNETTETINEYRVINGRYYGVLTEKKAVSTDNRRHNMQSEYTRFVVEKQGSILWLAFSHIQWSAKYAMQYMQDADFRSIRGQRYDTKSFVAPDSGYIGTTNIFFEPMTDREKLDIGNSDSQLRMEHRFSEICAEESFCKVKKEIENMAEQHKKFMVSFSIHDPVGCAEDLCDDYAWQTSYHAAMTQGLPYAKTAEEMLQNKANIGFIDSFDDETSQYYALYQSAFLLNELILKNNNNNHNYGGELKREWVKKVLALTEREKSLDNMIGTHSTLYTILTSNYYQNMLVDMCEASFKQLAIGQDKVLNHHKLFAFVPNYVERNPEKEYYFTEWEKDDYMYNSFYYGNAKPQKPQITKSTTLQYVVRELLNIDFRKTNLFNLMVVDKEKLTSLSDVERAAAINQAAEATRWANSLAINVDTSLGLYKFFLKAEQDKRQYLSRIESIANMKAETIRMGKYNLEVLLKQFNSDADGVVQKASNLGWFQRVFFGKKHYNKAKSDLLTLESNFKTEQTNIVKLAAKETAEYDEQIKALNQDNLELENKLKRLKWLDSGVYKKILTTLSVANLIYTTQRNYEKGFDFEAKISEVGTILETSSVILAVSLSEAQNEFILKALFGKTANIKFTVAARIGIFATAVLAISTIYDGVQLYNRQDYLAGSLQILSGLAGLASCGAIWAGYAAGATGLAAIGPVGWALIIASVILIVISAIVQKDDFELFLRHSVFGNRSDNWRLQSAEMQPVELMKLLYNKGNPKALVFEDENDDVYDLRNFREMLGYLFDKIAYFRHYVKAINYYRAPDWYGRLDQDWNIVTRFELVFSFKPVLSFAKLEYAMRIYYNNGHSAAYIEPVDGSPIITTAEDGSITTRFIFDLGYPALETVTIYNQLPTDTKSSPPADKPMDEGRNKITIQNMKTPDLHDPYDLRLNNSSPKEFGFMFRILDRDASMSLPLSPELDDPLYYVIQGALYSPYIQTSVTYRNNPFMQNVDPHLMHPISKYIKKTKSELNL